jgi:hypothetical protein
MAVESFTIVASILLAFAIQAWWESLQETDLRNQAFVTLEEELTLLDTLLAWSDDRSKSVAAGAALLIQAAQDPASAPAEGLTDALADLTGKGSTDASLTSYDLLVNSGNLDVLRDPALTKHLVQLRTLMVVKDRVEARELAFIEGQLEPFIGSFVQLPGPGNWYERWGVTPPEVRRSGDLGMMLRDPQFLSLVTRRTWFRRNIEFFLERMRIEMVDLRARLPH